MVPAINSPSDLAPSEPRQDLLALYRVFSILAGIYADTRRIASGTAHSAMDDLGVMSHIWESARTAQSPKSPSQVPPGPPAVPKLISVAAQRFEILQRLLHTWVNLNRKSRILMVMERQWQRALLTVPDEHWATSAPMRRLIANSHSRVGSLQSFAVSYQEYCATLRGNYSLPQAMVH
jgi:hypothetical protein